MTLLVLDLRLPERTTSGAADDRLLWAALVGLAPRLVTYLMSFLTLGIFWLGQQTQLSHASRSDRVLAWTHLSFLLAVTLLPFSTALLAGHLAGRLALGIYWLNLLALGAALFAAWRYAARVGLLSADATPQVRAAVERRIVRYQAAYAAAAALCALSTAASIGALVLLQLRSVLGARRRLRGPQHRGW